MNTNNDTVIVYACSDGHTRVYTIKTAEERENAARSITTLMGNNYEIPKPVAPIIPDGWRKYVDLDSTKVAELTATEKEIYEYSRNTFSSAWFAYEAALNAWENVQTVVRGFAPSIVEWRRKLSESDDEWNAFVETVADSSSDNFVADFHTLDGVYSRCSIAEAFEWISPFAKNVSYIVTNPFH